jgi:hypothetical protein
MDGSRSQVIDTRGAGLPMTVLPMTLTVIPSEHHRLAGDVHMAKYSEYGMKEKVDEAGQALEKGIGDVAGNLRKKGSEFKEYLKKVHAEVEEWKFGVEEAKDGFRVEWRLVAVIRRPKKKGEEKD